MLLITVFLSRYIKIIVVNIEFYFSIRRSAGYHVESFNLIFELRKEVKVFIKERDYDIIKEMESKEFIQVLAYLSDIFSCLNNMSVSMQGINVIFLKCREIMNAFKKKLNLWCRRVEGGNLSNFHYSKK